jgi:glycosyltransferase involved in cell wall biosynthesis
VVLLNTPARDEVVQSPAPPLRSFLPIRPEHRILFYCGRLSAHRGLENLIRSLHTLQDCHVVLMGYGADAFVAKLDALARDEGLGDRYSRFGPVPPEEVSSYSAGADLGVAPIENVCLNYYYCTPNKLFQYLHAGLPVIASDFPEMRALIERHGVGVTFDPSDPDALARAARAVLDDPVALEGMRTRARAAAEHYCWERESEKLLAIYRTLDPKPNEQPRL